MKIKVFLVSVIIIIKAHGIGFSQTYQTQKIIEKTKKELENIVGNRVASYFEYDTNTYYEYLNWRGKTKWKTLDRKKATKGKFVKVDIRFRFKPPNFPWNHLFTVIGLDDSLNLVNEPITDFIPDFIIKDEPSNFLAEKEVEKIIKRQNLKESAEPATKRLEFNKQTRKYEWIVINIIYEEKCFSDVEILKINPITGKVEKHFEERQVVLHCF